MNREDETLTQYQSFKCTHTANRTGQQCHLLQTICFNAYTIKLFSNSILNLIHTAETERENAAKRVLMIGINKVYIQIDKITKGHAVATRCFYIARCNHVAVNGNTAVNHEGQMAGGHCSQRVIRDKSM